MKANLLIAIDCSTTACKAVVWNERGYAVATGRHSYGLSYVGSSWVEQNAPDWWVAACSAIVDAVTQVGASHIAGIAITHQRETFVCLDKEGMPLRPAITWMDMRATAEVDEFGNSDVHRITGKPPNPTPAWYKLLWLKKHEPKIFSKIAHVVDVGGFLVNKLTGEWATSWSSADPLGLVDMQSFDYHDGLLQETGLSRDNFGRLLPPGTIVGGLTKAVAEHLGLPSGLPVVVGAGDGQSAGLGCNLTQPGRAYLNLGTGAVSGIFSSTYTHGKSYRTMGGAVPGTYILETFIGGGTQNISWFIDKLTEKQSLTKPGETHEQHLEVVATEIPIGAEGLLCLPYWSGAMTPYWDGNARGAFVGLSGVHSKAHIYRAILEGIAFEQRLLTSGVESETGTHIEEVLVLGGGSRSSLWCQIIANVLGRPVKLVREQECTALGAGIHAAAALGLHPDLLTAANNMSGIEKTYEPDISTYNFYSKIYPTYCSIYPGLRETFRLNAESK